MKFSDCVGQLTELWLLWMKCNSKVKDIDLPIKERKLAADQCEELIDKEYTLVENLDNFFNE